MRRPHGEHDPIDAMRSHERPKLDSAQSSTLKKSGLALQLIPTRMEQELTVVIGERVYPLEVTAATFDRLAKQGYDQLTMVSSGWSCKRRDADGNVTKAPFDFAVLVDVVTACVSGGSLDAGEVAEGLSLADPGELGRRLRVAFSMFGCTGVVN